MTAVFASAPGKVVLSGEYAVLDGAPAICMAVNRRARVAIAECDEAWNRVTAPGYASHEGRFVVDGDAIVWLQGEDEFKIVDAVWRTVARSTAGCLSIELDTRAFVDAVSGEKVGIGSSAALTVALVAALCQSTNVLADAGHAHRSFQHGIGSGVDVATSAIGGLVEYRLNETRVSNIRWPTGLAYRLIWTGVPASTRRKLEYLQAADHRRSKAELVTAAADMAEAWRSAEDVLGAFPKYIATLRQFSVDHDLGIFDAGHERLVSEAAAAGLVYKPCGAGGGDVGILLGASNEQLEAFVTEKTSFGDKLLQCELDTQGVELEQH